MQDIAKIDKNFLVQTSINKDDVKFYNVDEKPFKVYGIFRENGKYRRLPEKVAETVSEGVLRLHANTAGGRVKFKTDSKYIAISAKMDAVGKMPHFAMTGSVGFDLYVGDIYKTTFLPPFDITEGFDSILEFPNKEMRDVTINFPLYSEVKNLYVGLQEDSVVAEGSPYKNEKPIVYYGSSITQGACASRAGMSYQNIISRRFNYHYVNLGFSGNAKGEDTMVEYIKNLDMSAFVYDYDFNAPTVEHLENTHEKMFKAIRKEHPEIPIFIMSRPKHYLTDDEKERRRVIETTYNNAISNGDKNVYFLDGKLLTELCKNEGTVDDVHPTDFGFASMANALADVIIKNGISL